MLCVHLNIEDNILVSVCLRLYKQVKTRNTAVYNITYNMYNALLINEFDLIKNTNLLFLRGN